tara:strand:- start:3674 stop:5731 length:2058 start_codon:yes stop_codon:yes gene_type:complete
MTFIKNLFALLFISCSNITNINLNVNAYMLQPNSYLNSQLKPKIRVIPKLYMSSVPDYDPSKLINSLARTSNDLDKWSLKEFLSEISHKHIESATLVKNPATDSLNAVILIDNNYKGVSNLPELDNIHYLETGIQKINNIVIDTLLNNDIFYSIIQAPANNQMQGFDTVGFLINSVVLYFIISFIFTLIQQFRGGAPGSMMNPMNAGRLQSRGVINSDDIDATFEDVAGCDEAKYELQEVVEFLKEPDKFYSAGAKVPKGVLLEGPPGTGKTLLARAVAGEAGVSFIQVSASEFIQMFVGVGASRVRDLFDTAKKNSPCVVFIDEIDAVGRKRGEQFNGGGNEEREQTLNQILTNMDGFEKTDSIIVLAATNRADILDSALTRSGRFDRKVKVGLPDILGRRQILDVHLRDKFVEPNTDLDEIAILTSGFSGADIENMANEAAILAIRQNKTIINSTNLVDAYEKITIGLPVKSRKINEDEAQLVAYHEAGHTLTALLFKEFFDVRKVTILPNTNGAGGYTLFTPKEKFTSYPTKKYLLANLIVTMGGRAAEIVLFNKILNNQKNIIYNSTKIFDSISNLDITTGASGDLKQADNLGRRYVELFGIENGFTPKTIQSPDNPYLSLSENTKSEIDDYVNNLTNIALNKAVKILENNIDSLNKLADDLIIKKTVDLKYLQSIDVEYF